MVYRHVAKNLQITRSVILYLYSKQALGIR